MAASLNESNPSHLTETYQRRWSIITGQSSRFEAETGREQFERIARQAMIEQDFRYSTPVQAIDSWLDLLKKESPYCENGWAIKELAVASAVYCAELRTRALEADNLPRAQTFGDLERQFRELPDPKRKLHAIERGIEQHATPILTPADSLESEAHDDIAAERRRLLQAYKEEGAKRRIKITDKMVAQAASSSWHDRTPVDRWKRNDPRCTKGEDAKIRYVLKKRPHFK